MPVPGLWKHKTQTILFTLIVDDFGVKHVSKEHVKHLKHVLEEHYKATAYWTGTSYTAN
ncbi:hypothetical protein ACHAW6_002196 [Cyclotella cf. meneghiniana]